MMCRSDRMIDMKWRLQSKGLNKGILETECLPYIGSKISRKPINLKRQVTNKGELLLNHSTEEQHVQTSTTPFHSINKIKIQQMYQESYNLDKSKNVYKDFGPQSSLPLKYHEIKKNFSNFNMRFNSQQKDKIMRKYESLEMKERGFNRKGSYCQNKNFGCSLDKNLQKSLDNKRASPTHLGRVLDSSAKQVQTKGSRNKSTSVCINQNTSIPQPKKGIHNSLVGLDSKETFQK